MMRRGYTLIDLMIAIAVLGIGAQLLIDGLGPLERGAARTIEREGLVRALDIELERMRACPDRPCLDDLVATGTISASAEGWTRLEVERSVAPGPDQTLRISVRGSGPLGGEMRLDALVGDYR